MTSTLIPTLTKGAAIELGDDDAFTLDMWARSLHADQCSKKTIKTYLEAGRSFLHVFRQLEPAAPYERIEKNHVKAWLSAMRDADYEPSSILSRYTGMQAFMRWLIEEGDLMEDPLKNMKRPTVPELLIPTVTLEDLKALIDACKGREFRQVRDTAIIRFLLDSGPRVSEIVGLQLGDVDVRRGLAVVTGKGNKQRQLPFGNKTALALGRYLRTRAGQPRADLPTFFLGATGRGPFTDSGVRQMLESRCKEAGLGHIHPHQLRHTMATNFLDNLGQERELAILLGHASTQMAERYTRTTKVKRALQAHQRLALGDQV